LEAAMNKILATMHHYARTSPDKIAVIDSQTQLSYGQLASQVNSLAHWLAGKNIARLGLEGENSSAWIVADLACWQAGITLIPLPLFFSAEQIQHVLDLSQLQWILRIAPMPATNAAKIQHETPVPRLILESTSEQPIEEKPNNNGIAKITFTSGTSGQPKGVCLDDAAIEQVTLALASRIQSSMVASELTTHLNLLPLSTLLENIAGVYVPLYLGKAITVLAGNEVGLLGSSQLSLPILLQTLNNYRPSSLIVLPQILQGLVAAAKAGYAIPDSLKFIAVGGAHTPVELLHQARQLQMPVYEGYGLSECASVVSLNYAQADKVGSVGKPLGHLHIKIDAGEIKVRGNAFRGYLGQPAISPDEWLDTGDLGYIDEDGFLFIQGRKKNLLISSFGRNISPEWLEAQLCLSAHIAQSLVFGDAKPFCGAVIVPSPAAKTETITADIARINQTLPDYARIKKWILAKSAFTSGNNQLTSNGRIRREAILAAYDLTIQASYATARDNSESQLPFDQFAGELYDVF
jgi:long-chain acyl-CoA synthetase